ncbi:MAG: type Z 30S ribosomal protein S14 [Spirochaetia bacterium]|nr:type Z 30S ribosomal protein S14 [Spirochaetia bacterium]
MAKKSARMKQRREPKFSSRRYNRCPLCGRPKAYMRRFDMCRICFRESASAGIIPGVTKSSW